MIVAQADPRFENTWPAYVQQRYMLEGLGLKSPETRRATGFDEFLTALEKGDRGLRQARGLRA